MTPISVTPERKKWRSLVTISREAQTPLVTLEWLYCFETWLKAQQQHHEKTYQNGWQQHAVHLRIKSTTSATTMTTITLSLRLACYTDAQDPIWYNKKQNGITYEKRPVLPQSEMECGHIIGSDMTTVICLCNRIYEAIWRTCNVLILWKDFCNHMVCCDLYVSLNQV